MSIKKKAITGLTWTFAQQAGIQGINFIVQILLARLLMPEAFGLIAMLHIFFDIGKNLMDGGMTSSLIRTKNADQADYSTVFFINLFSSLFLYAVLFFSGPLIANFYNQPELEQVIKVYALVVIIQALNAVQTTRLTKEMNFRLQMFMEIPSVMVAGAIAIALAYKGFGVWSLVYMHIIRAFLFMVQHWIFTGWRPHFVFDLEKLKIHFNFGYKLTLSGLIATLYSNINKIIIGKLFSAAQLGFYHQANTLRMFPVNNISIALKKVTYPLFSRFQNDDKALVKIYKSITKVIFWFVIPVMLFLIINAEDIFILLLTEKWLPSVPYFQILAFSAIFYPHSMYSLNILGAKGRSDLHLKSEFLKKGLSILVLIGLIHFGVIGVVVSSAIGMLLGTIINSYNCGKLINYSLLKQLTDIAPFLTIGVSTSLLYFIIYQKIASGFQINSILFLACGFLIYNTFYFTISFIFINKELKTIFTKK